MKDEAMQKIGREQHICSEDYVAGEGDMVEHSIASGRSKSFGKRELIRRDEMVSSCARAARLLESS